MRIIGTRTLPLLLVCVLTTPAGWSAVEGDGYRLTGVIAADDGMAFAVIENADGQQKLLREGEAIGTGQVKLISPRDKTVVLAFPAGEISLRLTGSGTVGAAPEEEQEEYSIENFAGEAAQRSLTPLVIRKLKALAKSRDSIDEQQLALQFNELLGLSPQAQVAAYDDRGVHSTRAVLEQLGARISALTEQNNFLGTLAVADENGRRRVYLMAESTAE